MGRFPARSLATLLLFLLPLVVFHRALFFGEAFVPADQLGHLFPYKTQLTGPAPWNVLRFDGITQFYPWRLEVARQWSEGHIPFWNPYQFGASGGTPLLANSQSAPFYPLNLLFLVCYKLGVFWYAFGLVAALHLLLAIKGTYHYLRSLSLSRAACLLGAVTFGLSGPLITWLALPTFLSVVCWLPWLLLVIRRAHREAGTKRGLRYGIVAGGIAGLMMLGGHLQMAFYCLLTAGIYLLWEGHFAVRLRKQATIAQWIGVIALAGVLMGCFVAPQLLPTLELSRVSHRAAAGPPTMESYNAFTASAVPVRNLVTFLVPDFFGHPNHNDGFYWNDNNYAEWCSYVGVLPLVLAVFALALPWKGSPLPLERAIFGGLLVLTLLMAMGTPVNLPFFFLVPGFSQLGNPGRILAITALCLAILAAFGLHGLLDNRITVQAKQRAGFIAVVVPLLLAAIGASQAVPFATKMVPNTPFGQLMTAATPGLMVGVVFLMLTIGVLVVGTRPAQRQLAVGGAVMLVLADLTLWGYDYNPTRPAKDVYPVTPGIAYLQQNAQNALIAPLNRRWSLYAVAPPKDAILPPNGLTVYRLHDITGYDSLFRGASKEQIKTAAGGEDPCPPENGNMVFVKSVEAAVRLNARYIVVPPDVPDLSPAGITSVYTGPDMVIYQNPNGTDIDATASQPPLPDSLKIGLAAATFGLILFIVGLAWARR